VYRVVATVLAAALSAPPGEASDEKPAPENAPAADAPAEGEPATDEDRDAQAEPDGGDVTEPATDEPEPEESGLPSVEDPPEEATPPPKPEPEPTSEPAPKAEGPTPAPAPALPARRDRLGCDFSKSCRQLTITGTALGSVGLVAVGAGVALFVRDDEVIPDEPAYAKSTKPPGLVALTLGSGVVVTSILMLFASHRRGKNASDEGVARWLSPRGGRF